MPKSVIFANKRKHKNMARHNDTGHWGEDMAADYLTEHGYAIVARNWRIGKLELDIVAMKDDTLIIAEVKTRNNKEDDPLESIDNKKILNIVHAADAFVKQNELPHSVRFDLFAINGTPDDYTFEHVPDAFYPPLKTYN